MKSLTKAFGAKREQPFDKGEGALSRADRARDAKDWVNAAEAYGEALSTGTESPGVWVQYGHALKESGRPEEAEPAYRRALALDPTDADAYVQLGHLLKILGRKPEAAECYLDALETDYGCVDAFAELESLAKAGTRLPADRAMAVLGTLPEIAPEADPTTPATRDSAEAQLRSATRSLARLGETGLLDKRGADALDAALRALDQALETSKSKAQSSSDVLVFDVADLLGYFRNARLPTGIQRVQIEVVRGLLAGSNPNFDVRVCGFMEGQDDWVEIPTVFFQHLCALSLKSGDATDPAWLNVMRRLELMLLSSSPMTFTRGASLVNLGTSWWLQNYFLNIRRVKSLHQITYIPFVHDLIPVMMPEHCIPELTQDFITWILGVFQHADLFLVNSKSTKRDLLRVAATLGHAVDENEVVIVPLDADFRRSDSLNGGEALLRKWGLRPGGFVLLVSTIESRKNHTGAFNAWSSLIRKHGAAVVPQLVCVGNTGWLNDAVHAKLASSEALRSRVKMLSRLSDEELASLYKNSLFTLYPSHYEGWGLPVTESLCYGKPVLVSDVSSLPEAGGVFADYFQAGSDSGLATAAERLIFDDDYRAERTSHIRDGFKPRPWAAIGEQIGAAVSRLHAELQDEGSARAARAVEPMAATLGVYYPLTRNFELRVWRGMVLGEMFRAGAGWWWPDDWGVWTKPCGGDLAIRIEGPHRPLRLYMRIRGVFDHRCQWSFDIISPRKQRSLTGSLGPDEWRWLTIDLPASTHGMTILGSLSGDQSQDLALRTGGLDKRVTSVGLVGFLVCEQEDLAQRLAFAEAVLLNDFASLSAGHDSR